MSQVESIIGQPQNFTERYVALRQSEGRMYADEQVIQLPDISKKHPHFHEWQIRRRTAEKFIQYLRNKPVPLSILDVGCGNGWLSAAMATITSAKVTAIDVNKVELEQAARIFNDRNNLTFIEADVCEFNSDKSFDIIVFAASLQYFESLDQILNIALNRLARTGEIHIIDTYFYTRRDIQSAVERSARYYESIGFADMKNHYFHHCINDLYTYNFKILYSPHSLVNRLFKTKSPFYWIRIRHNDQRNA